MDNLVPRDSSFREPSDFRRDFDQFFDRMVSSWPLGETRIASNTGAFAPDVESYVDKDAKTYRLRVAHPGVDSRQVQIHAQGNTLTISGERNVKRTDGKTNWHLRACSPAKNRPGGSPR